MEPPLTLVLHFPQRLLSSEARDMRAATTHSEQLCTQAVTGSKFAYMYAQAELGWFVRASIGNDNDARSEDATKRVDIFPIRRLSLQL
jgi:hypothetical protein